MQNLATAEMTTREELLACLDHLIECAGHATLITRELEQTLRDHSAAISTEPFNFPELASVDLVEEVNDGGDGRVGASKHH